MAPKYRFFNDELIFSPKRFITPILEASEALQKWVWFWQNKPFYQYPWNSKVEITWIGLLCFIQILIYLFFLLFFKINELLTLLLINQKNIALGLWSVDYAAFKSLGINTFHPNWFKGFKGKFISGDISQRLSAEIL